MNEHFIKEFSRTNNPAVAGIILVILGVFGFPEFIETAFPVLGNENIKVILILAGVLLFVRSLVGIISFVRKFHASSINKDKTDSEPLLKEISVVRKDNSSNRLLISLLIAGFIAVFVYENMDHFHKMEDMPVQKVDKPLATQIPQSNQVAPPVSIKLYQAIAQNDFEKVRLYSKELKQGEINTVVAGMTPVMKASSVGNAELVEFLIAHGADPNKRGSQKRTALQYAAERNRLSVAKILLEHGADINGTDTSNLSPLTMAADRRYRDFALYLIEKGADVNIQHVQGWTALIDAARNGDLLLVQRLIEAGADIKMRTNNGITALDIARSNNHHDVEAYLMKQYEK